MDAITGTSGNDTINALQVENNAGLYVGTLAALDNIDGGAGTDTLNIISTAEITDPVVLF